MDTKEQKTPDAHTTTDTNQPVNLVDKEPIEVAMEGAPVQTATDAVSPKRSNKYTIVTIVLVVVALLIVLFQLEKQDRVSTNVFGGVIAALEANAPVAVVNGEKLSAEALEVGIGQLSQTAAAQGLDPADPTVQAEIKSQAVDMLVNTTLLQQAAIANGIEIDDEAVNARIDELAEAAGGQEALAERLAEFEIDEAQLIADVTDELTIRALLDVVFADADVAVTDEEIAEVYQNAVDANGAEGLPPLAEVRDQIAAQLTQTKEQAVVDAYLQELRADADIELN